MQAKSSVCIFQKILQFCSPLSFKSIFSSKILTMKKRLYCTYKQPRIVTVTSCYCTTSSERSFQFVSAGESPTFSDLLYTSRSLLWKNVVPPEIYSTYIRRQLGFWNVDADRHSKCRFEPVFGSSVGQHLKN